MRKNTLSLLFFLILCKQIQAQQPAFGISGALTGFNPKYDDKYMSVHKGPQPDFILGLLIEANYIIRGYGFPVSAFNGIGLSIYQPVNDSVVLDGWNHSYWPHTFSGTSRRSYRNISFHFGYEIPQPWNDFLFLHIGWGMGCSFQKVKYDLQDFNTADCLLVNPDIKLSTMTEKHGAFIGEVMLGGMYEFEKIYVLFQYALRVATGNDLNIDYRFQNSVTAGVFFPLKKF